MDQFEYFGTLMRRGSVTSDELQNAWRFTNNYPHRSYLALMGEQLELPAEVDQGLVYTDLLCTDGEGQIDLSTLSLQALPDCVSDSVRGQLAEALANLRAAQVLEEASNDIKTSEIDREQLSKYLRDTGKQWYLRHIA